MIVNSKQIIQKGKWQQDLSSVFPRIFVSFFCLWNQNAYVIIFWKKIRFAQYHIIHIICTYRPTFFFVNFSSIAKNTYFSGHNSICCHLILPMQKVKETSSTIFTSKHELGSNSKFASKIVTFSWNWAKNLFAIYFQRTQSIENRQTSFHLPIV